MIGFFDSGLGGLTILKDVERLLPDYSYIYLGDNARSPYGSRSQEIIYQFTKEGAEELFKRGAELIILACNTSSASALRKIQQEFLPVHYPDRRILGIIIPTAEEVENFITSKNIGILATEATVNSKAYVSEIAKINPEIKVFQQACPLFAPIIEAGEVEWEGLDLTIKKYLNELFSKSGEIDAVILGCTHYAIIEESIKKYLPAGAKLISQGAIIAEKLKEYLARHIEFEMKLDKQGRRIFLTTENSQKIKNLAKVFYGEGIVIESISIE